MPTVDPDTDTILAIVNAAAEAYRDVIPADRWHEPYMSVEELRSELAAGVRFATHEVDGEVIGVMGIQSVRNVDLIRHAYVLPARQCQGVGSALMRRMRQESRRQILVGTWAAATWAIAFYERHGFVQVADDAKTILLTTYWTIPERQVEESVVLAAPSLTLEQARKLVA